MPLTQETTTDACDVLLIGAGIMSATLGVLLKELDPTLSMQVFERLNSAAAESSDAWNNAGTGHSAFCELNYTTEKPDGSMDVSKAVKVAESFELSRQWWASLVEQKLIAHPENFIRSIPHESFVWEDKNVDLLKKRHAAMTANPLFKGMLFSDDPKTIAQWMPLVMQGRNPKQKVAATRMDAGTDVNFGALTRALFQRLESFDDVQLHYHHDVKDIQRLDDPSVYQKGEGRDNSMPRWKVRVKDHDTGERRTIRARFVFIGAGGGALPLLLKSDIPEGRHFGGFPVSGQWLRCTNAAVIVQHHAKVYGKASVGAPPMSVPHLDTRFIDGKQALLFGPYAGFSTKFLKEGSLLDLPKSITLRNLGPMLMAGLHNFPLTRYLIEQVTQSDEDRLAALREYYPEAKEEDWEIAIAGQRVQVIKKDEEEGGILEFGTEVVAAADGSLAALLGASPGASTAVAIMLDLLKKCFPEPLDTVSWQEKIRALLPSYGKRLSEDEPLLKELRVWTSSVLLKQP